MSAAAQANAGLKGPAPIRRSRWPVLAGIVLALAVLAATILVSLLHLRQRIFEQIASRDGDILNALAAQQFLDDKANDESITGLSDPAVQIDLAAKISRRLPTVYGVRLFSPAGKFETALPVYITEATLPPADLAVLTALKPVSHFVPDARMTGQDLLAETNSAPEPLLEISIPLREPERKRLEGIAQFLIYGASIAREYAELDRHLAAQGGLAFFVGGTLLTTGMLLAFRRVQQANARLAERTRNLLQANRELALAAKTSAIGAVTAHLIHGLKNPLSGLRSFVQDRALEGGEGSDWQLAVTSTQRMQSLIDRVVRVLQEQQNVAEYEVAFEEILEMLSAKVRPLAREAGVRYAVVLQAAGNLSNREADLILLILENLVQNAIEATPSGKTVQLSIGKEGADTVMEVSDQGPGLSAQLKERLFTPGSSAKKGGSGIGLAISRQLATHLGARLELKESSPDGCRFRLVLPPGGMVPAANATRGAMTPAASTAATNR